MKFDRITNFISNTFVLVLYVLAILGVMLAGFELVCVICSRFE